MHPIGYTPYTTANLAEQKTSIVNFGIDRKALMIHLLIKWLEGKERCPLEVASFQCAFFFLLSVLLVKKTEGEKTKQKAGGSVYFRSDRRIAQLPTRKFCKERSRENERDRRQISKANKKETEKMTKWYLKWPSTWERMSQS